MSELIRTDLRMVFRTKKYYMTLLSTVLTAVAALVLIRLMAGQYQYLEPEFIEMLGSSGFLNLYVIKVKCIEDILNLTGADMMHLCFGGCFLPGVIAVFSVTWVTYGYRTGTTRFFVARGCTRYQMVLSKFLSGAVGAMGILMVYLLTSAIGGVVLGGFGKLDGIGFLGFLAVQSLVYLAFGCLCMAAAYVIENEAIGIVCMISLIVALPDLLRYLRIFTNSTRDYELLWILSYSSRLALGDLVPAGLGAFLMGGTLLASVLLSISVFGRKEIK